MTRDVNHGTSDQQLVVMVTAKLTTNQTLSSVHRAHFLNKAMECRPPRAYYLHRSLNCSNEDRSYSARSAERYARTDGKFPLHTGSVVYAQIKSSNTHGEMKVRRRLGFYDDVLS